MKVPAEEQLRCVTRELSMRKYVYPRLVTEGKMSQRKADEEIAAMSAVVDTLRERAEVERLL